MSDLSHEVTKLGTEVAEAAPSSYADRWISKISHLEINIAAKKAGLKGFCAREKRIFTPHRKGEGENKRPSQDNRGINDVLIQWIGQMAWDEWR